MRKAIASSYMLILIFMAFCFMQIAYADTPINTNVILDRVAPVCSGITIGEVDSNGKIPVAILNMKDVATGLNRVEWTATAPGMSDVSGSEDLRNTGINTDVSRTIYFDYAGNKSYSVEANIYDGVGKVYSLSNSKPISSSRDYSAAKYVG